MAHVLEFIYAFFRETGRAPGPEEIYRFSHHHFFWATIVAFVLVCLVIILLSPNFSEVRRSLSEISLTRRAVLLLSIPTFLIFCAAVLLASFFLSPSPSLEGGIRLAPFVAVMCATSRLSPLLPGTMTGPLSPPFFISATVSRRRPAFCCKEPWQA